LEHNSVHIRRL